MNRWAKRAGYLLVILLWLILVSFPILAFLLATQGQIQIGDSSSGLRLFLLEDTANQGLGIQWTRSYNNPNTAGPNAANCTRTTLRYLLWEGDPSGQNTDYCQCFDAQTEQPLASDACTLP